MKKIVCFVLSFSLLLGMSTTVFASSYSEKSPITVINGTSTTDYIESIPTRATSAPTAYAPSSWYETTHSWAAVNYTWSAYKFTNSAGRYFYAIADKSFNVQLYYGDGTSMGTWSADLQSDGTYLFNAVMSGSTAGYYFRLINTSGSPITSSDHAYYSVSGSGS